MFKMLMQQEGAETCQIQEKHPKVRENTLKLPKVRKKGPNLSKDAEIVNFRTLFHPYTFFGELGAIGVYAMQNYYQ